MSLIINDIPPHPELFFYTFRLIASKPPSIRETELRQIIDPKGANSEVDRTLFLLETLGLLSRREESFSVSPQLPWKIENPIEFRLAFLRALWKQGGANRIIRRLYLFVCKDFPVFRCAENSDPLIAGFNRWLDGEGRPYRDMMTADSQLEGKINKIKADHFGRLMSSLGLATQVYNRAYMASIQPDLLYRSLRLVVPKGASGIPISSMLQHINEYIPVDPSEIHTPFATALWRLKMRGSIVLRHIPDLYAQTGKPASDFEMSSGQQREGIVMTAQMGGPYNEISLSSD